MTKLDDMNLERLKINFHKNIKTKIIFFSLIINFE